VDRAALDVAIELGIPYRGFIPQGRWAEDGRVPSRYKGLTECDSTDPAVRTRLNVEDSDATLILSHGKLSGGSLVTWQASRNSRKPCLHVDLGQNSDDAAIDKIILWLRDGEFTDLNVAGPRASKDPEAYDRSHTVLTRVFKKG
jgi:hypothetical protein